jgi:hypothetical protein
MNAVVRLALLALAASVFLAPHSAAAAPARCFAETGQCISGRFLSYWEQNGGLPVFGFPITPAREEQTPEGRYLVQSFERNRFELHPEKSAPYDVLLGRYGAEGLSRRGESWEQQPRASARDGCLFFAETGHALCEPFLSYWRAHGLEFDGRAGTSYAESLALFGFPLLEQRTELNSSGDRVPTQWFERARFEHHDGSAWPVQLGLLGRELSGATGVDPTIQRVIDLTNGERAAQGLPAVSFNAQLAAAALLHSQDMASNNFVSHVGSNGSTAGQRIDDAGYPWLSYGENVAAGFSSADAVFKAWMESPSHRENILGASFREIGIAMVQRSGTTHTWYWTMELGSR